jgi:sugar lactone lactonase YvrE
MKCANPIQNRLLPEIFILFFFSVFFIFCTKQMQEEDGHAPPRGLELVFQDSTFQLTGVAVSNEFRVFTSYPLWSDIYKYAVSEVTEKNKLPYPNMDWNSWKPGDDGNRKWVCVQAVHVDDSNFLWVVDPASPMQKGVYQNSQKLVKINLVNNQVIKSYSLAGATDAGSYANDVRIDYLHKSAYLTNSTEGGIIIVDLLTEKVRQVLQGHHSVISDPSYILTIDGRVVKKNDTLFKANSDGLAVSPDNKYLYYKPLTDDKLYRIQTAFLMDTALDAATLGAKVEDLGHFTTTDGMIFDKKGNLYLGDLEHHRIMRIDSLLHMSSILQDVRLIWPDSYQISADDYLYISCSQIDRQPEYNHGVNKRTTPYAIYKYKL